MLSVFLFQWALPTTTCSFLFPCIKITFRNQDHKWVALKVYIHTYFWSHMHFSLNSFSFFSILSTIITLFYIRSLDFIHHITRSLHPFTNFSPLSPPQSLKTTIPVFMNLIFYILHISVTMQYLLFSLISLIYSWTDT